MLGNVAHGCYTEIPEGTTLYKLQRSEGLYRIGSLVSNPSVAGGMLHSICKADQIASEGTIDFALAVMACCMTDLASCRTHWHSACADNNVHVLQLQAWSACAVDAGPG